MATPKTFLTLGQAAKATGKSKGTLSKAVSSGMLAVAEKIGNQYKIDPAELFRVFPQKEETFQNVSYEQMETPKETIGNGELQLKIKHLEELLRREESAHADTKTLYAETKAEKGRLMDMLDNQTRLLTHLKDDMQKPVLEATEKRQGFLGRMLWKK
jgi:hypothetical protein